MQFQGLAVKDTPKHPGQAAKQRIFELIGGHPALDLVNTLDWRFRESGSEDLLTGYEDLLGFVTQAKLISAAQARRFARTVPPNKAQTILASVRDLREATAELLYSELEGRTANPHTLKTLETFVRQARTHQELVRNGSKLVWEFAESNAPELPLWLLSMESGELVTSDAIQKLRACGNPECQWLFLDSSKNHTRRWCDMKICGNRMKARRFKAQHRQ
jgi:predicted RNA-binding Zn ribbon-like protein